MVVPSNVPCIQKIQLGGNNYYIDKPWKIKQQLISSDNTATTTTVSLSSYLPNDSNDYEVLFTAHGYNSGSSYPLTFFYTADMTAPSSTTDYSAPIPLIAAGTNSRSTSLSFILPIKASTRYIYKKQGGAYSSYNYLHAIAYRQIIMY